MKEWVNKVLAVAFETELHEHLRKLPTEQQREVLDFGRRWRASAKPNSKRVTRSKRRMKQPKNYNSFLINEKWKGILSTSPNWSLLGGTRFVLALIVVGFHLYLFGRPSRVLAYSNTLNGFAAVVAFLIISGYSIAFSYSKKPDGFFLRRVRRVYPTYFICVVFALIPFYFSPSIKMPAGDVASWPTIPVLLGNVFLLQPTFVKPMHQIGQNWTLGLECFFYLMVPLFARLSKKRLLIFISLSVLIFLLQGQLRHFNSIIISQKVGPLAIVALAWAWLIGWYLALYPRSSYSLFFLILSPGILMLNRQFSGPAEGGAFVVAGTNLVIACGHKVIIPKKWSSLLNYLGELSYPLYLVHVPFFYLVQVTTHRYFNPLVYIGASVIASALIYHLFDAPFRRLGSRQHQIIHAKT